jgi:AAHS family benzoate transporter-like MFS transporter
MEAASYSESDSSVFPAARSDTEMRRLLAICTALIVFDGYDLFSFGTVVPALLSDAAWSLTTQDVGLIGSAAIAGMLIGALSAGVAADVVGRRKLMVCCSAGFAFSMGLCALAPTPSYLASFRFVAGVGLGGLIPVTCALATEVAPPGRRALAYAVVQGGHPFGGALAALLATVVVPEFGWRAMFWIGALPLVTIVPLAWHMLPDDQPSTADRKLSPRRGQWSAASATVWNSRFMWSSFLFCVASFAGLLAIYGLNIWLPQLMRTTGHSLGSALTFMLILNAGAVAGTLLAALVVDRKQAHRAVAAFSFTIAAGCLALLAWSGLPEIMAYPLAALAGAGTIGTQTLVNAFVASRYPENCRATALGWTLGVGRVGALIGPAAGGFILAGGNAAHGFFGLAIVAAVGAGAIALVPARTRPIVPFRPSNRWKLDDRDHAERDALWLQANCAEWLDGRFRITGILINLGADNGQPQH